MGSNFQIHSDPWFWILMSILILVLPLPWLFALFFSSLVHELCHLAAVRFFGGSITDLRLAADGFYLRSSPMEHLPGVICSLAGPVGALSLLIFARWIPRTALCALVQSVYHLLPLYPLDGGRALRSLACAFSWGMELCFVIEWVVMILVGWLGLYLTWNAGLGLLPVCLAFLVILRTCGEKFLAKQG